MRAVFDEKNKVFLLHTQNTTYAIAVTEDKYVPVWIWMTKL